MSVQRLFAGPDGKSRMEDLELPEGEGVIKAIELTPGSIMRFNHRSEERIVDWHNTPNPNYMIVLSGAIEVGTGDGKVHTLRTGDVLLSEDSTGQGHNTKYVPPFLCVNVMLGE